MRRPTAEMEETPQKPKKVVDFVSHVQGTFGFAGFPAFGTAEMEGTPQKPESCRFGRVRSFCGSHFQRLLWDLLDFRLLRPPK